MSHRRPHQLPTTLLGLQCALFTAMGYWLGGFFGAGILSAVVAAFAIAMSWQLARNERRLTAALESRRTNDLPAEIAAAVDTVTQAAQTAEDARLAVENQIVELEARSRLLRHQQAETQSALNAVPSAVFLVDADGRELFANRAADAFLERWLISEDLPVASPDDAIEWLCHFARNATGKRGERLRFQCDNTVEEYIVKSASLGDDSQSCCLVISNTETGDRGSSARHAEFVGAASHELKTPMAGIQAYVELIQDGEYETPAERDRLCEDILSQIDRLRRMVDDMLNIARIESGVIKIEKQDCELNDILQRAVDIVKPGADAKSIGIRGDLSELYMPVHVDPDLMLQATINLVSNAVKYTSGSGTVRVSSRADELAAVIEVSDTGLGIPEDSLPRLFDRFYRVPGNSAAAEGTGLGLALVHDIVTKLHGGAISVQSQVGQGTTFRVQLPLGHRLTPRNRIPEECRVRASK